MSIKVMAQCWEQSQLAGTDLLMLLALADWSDDAGQCYPSIDKLAQKCRMSRRNAQFILKNLEGSGELSVGRNAGPPPKFPNLYRINLDALGVKPISPVKPTSPVKSSEATGEIQRTNGVKPTSPNTSLIRHNTPARSRVSLRFEDFWSAYPSKRKGSKSRCLSVWQAKKLDQQADQIIAHVRLAAASDDWRKQSGQFIPAPLTYLNQSRWDGAELSDQRDGGDQFAGAI